MFRKNASANDRWRSIVAVLYLLCFVTASIGGHAYAAADGEKENGHTVIVILTPDTVACNDANTTVTATASCTCTEGEATSECSLSWGDCTPLTEGTRGGSASISASGSNFTTVGDYTIRASCNGATDSQKLTITPGIKSIASEGVSSSTSSPGDAETLYVARGASSATITITATPDPEDATWPEGQPTWSGATADSPPSTAKFDIGTASSTKEGTLVSATCGSKTVSMKIVVVDVAEVTTDKEEMLFEESSSYTAKPAPEGASFPSQKTNLANTQAIR